MNRVYRSRKDRWITGLCGGLAESFGISAGLLRLITVIAIPFSSGAIIFIYLIASLVISKEPYQPYDPYRMQGWHPGYGPGPGPGPEPGPYGDPLHDRRYQPRPPYGRPSDGPPPPPPPYSGRQANGGYRNPESNLDSMMEDIEKKAMEKELEELRRKLAKYENGNEKGDV
ncbi:hypothetical protein DCC85_18280 [Paenibacillus sp. CAA11]|uniref:PspC domain-containing protein n=1 Tax=Paenibacillus sp. CAA11 TaxID=1532905 RepID=UPI000D3B0D09|nr:PspC domain-containing protein [Paenibacillus sp. CAA11]AWB45944.1 hypothetical protein DCC85_18280 [Paenibacillus sp. CAA11]